MPLGIHQHRASGRQHWRGDSVYLVGLPQQARIKSDVVGNVRFGQQRRRRRTARPDLGPARRTGHHGVGDFVNRCRLDRDWPGRAYRACSRIGAPVTSSMVISQISASSPRPVVSVSSTMQPGGDQVFCLRCDVLATDLGTPRHPAPRHALGWVVHIISPLTLPDTASGLGV